MDSRGSRARVVRLPRAGHNPCEGPLAALRGAFQRGQVNRSNLLPFPALPLFVAFLACGNPDGEGSSTDSTSGEWTDDTGGDDKPDLVCLPDTRRCSDDATLEICAETGLEWEASPCSSYTTCVPCEDGDETCVAECKGPCESEDELPSSAGCSFVASRMIREEFTALDEVDGLMVGNPNSSQTATVQLYAIPEGKRVPVPEGDPVELPPGGQKVFTLTANFIDLTGFSRFRTGGNYRLVSDLPVVAYLHSPYQATNANDASMLLPEEALRTDYVIASFVAQLEPSYFDVIAIEDDTVVTWTPLVGATAGNGFPIDPVKAGKTGEIHMNRFDEARIAASSEDEPNVLNRDVSGTIVHANKPIWVVGASRCSRIPNGKEACDHLQEQMLPIDYWGNTYVGAPSPKRNDEPHIWRVFAGAKDGVTVTVDPPVVEPIVLSKRGEWVEFQVPNGVGFVLEGDGPFMPVQYLAGFATSGKIGDPSMYQMIPVEQFLERYVFVTGEGYHVHYVQIIRHKGGADVTVDDVLVTDYDSIGDFEVADVEIEQGPHLAESEGEFGIIQVGYTIGSSALGISSYAYPGGMKVEQISIP